MAENVVLFSIRTVNGDGCAMPPPPHEPKPPKKDLPPGPIIINFSSGKDQTLDLTDNGAVDFDSFEIVSSDLNVDYRRFMKVDGTTIKLAIPTQFRHDTQFLRQKIIDQILKREESYHLANCSFYVFEQPLKCPLTYISMVCLELFKSGYPTV